MPISRKRTTNRQLWDSNNMGKSVNEVIEHKKTLREACQKFGVSKILL